MRKAIAIVALAGFAGVASADVVANWAFNDNGLPGGGFGFVVGDFPMDADVGAGTMSLSAWDDTDNAGEYTTVDSFAGTDLDSIDSISGGSFSILGDTNNGASASFSISGVGESGLSLTFNRRGTSTGYTSMVVELFVDGSSAGVLESFGVGSSTWSSNTYDLSAGDGAADVTVVFTFDGATSSNGNNRLDNITFNAIPSPASAALLGLGGLVATRRRRA